jgi:hypothetical protein
MCNGCLGPQEALRLHGERQRPILAHHGGFDRRADCLPPSARVSIGQFLNQTLQMPVVLKSSVQVGLLSYKGSDSRISGVFSRLK